MGFSPTSLLASAQVTKFLAPVALWQVESLERAAAEASAFLRPIGTSAVDAKRRYSHARAGLCDVLSSKRNVRSIRLEPNVQQVSHQRHCAQGEIQENVSDHPSLRVPRQAVLSETLKNESADQRTHAVAYPRHKAEYRIKTHTDFCPRYLKSGIHEVHKPFQLGQFICMTLQRRQDFNAPGCGSHE